MQWGQQLRGSSRTTPHHPTHPQQRLSRRKEGWRGNGAASGFSIFRTLICLQTCARSEGCREGQLQEVEPSDSEDESQILISPEKGQSPPHPHSCQFCCLSQLPFLLALIREASEGRCPGKCLHGRLHNILFINSSTWGKTTCDLQVG